MAWLFFMDESGHDHKNTPMEARGGVALRERHLFAFNEDMRRLEETVFGASVASLGKRDFEIKGAKLLGNKTFEWASYQFDFSEDERRQAVRDFVTCHRQGNRPEKRGFYAWGMSKLTLADGVLNLLQKYDAKVFVSMIPRGVKPPPGFSHDDYLRKDQVFLFERYFNFLEIQNEYGLIIMDETEKENDRRFVGRMTNYFKKTRIGRIRTNRIVPTPFFVASDMVAGIQAADICIYATNWGYRLWGWDFKGPQRNEIANRYGALLSKLQFKGEVNDPETYETHMSYGIIFVPDPYTSRRRRDR